jgi:hypothetical protein
MAFDQYLSTHHRYTWRQISSIQLAQRLISIIVDLVLVQCLFRCLCSSGHLRIHDLSSRPENIFQFIIVSKCASHCSSTTRSPSDRSCSFSRSLHATILFLPFIDDSLYEYHLNTIAGNTIQLAITRLVSVVVSQPLREFIEAMKLDLMKNTLWDSSSRHDIVIKGNNCL